jgi:hypothetical protein
MNQQNGDPSISMMVHQDTRADVWHSSLAARERGMTGVN